MRCFYCGNLKEGELAGSDFPESERHHLFKVLKGKAGKKIMLIDGKGTLAEAEITGMNSVCVRKITCIPPPHIKLHLFTAPPRKQKLDQMLKQCSEVGVWSITLADTERGIAQPAGESAFSRMRQHLLEGCKQAHNPYIPELHHTLKLKDAVANIAEMESAWFGSTRGSSCEVSVAEHGEQNIAWFTGPEGGFTADEEKMMTDAGLQPLSLGRWIMRIETAAVIGSHFLISSALKTRKNQEL